MLRALHTFPVACALVVGLFACVACGGRQAAPTLPNGQPLEVMVLFDHTVAPETPAHKWTQLQQVLAFMEPDLLHVLRAAGYEAAALSSAGVRASGPGRYILKVQVTDYSGGSKAARMFIGFGAGSARLTSHFELLGPNGARYVTGSPSASTSRSDWQRVVRKVDQEIVAAVNVRLRQGL